MIEILFWPESQRDWDSKAWVVGWVDQDSTPEASREIDVNNGAVRTTVVLGCVAGPESTIQHQSRNVDERASDCGDKNSSSTTSNPPQEHGMTRDEMQKRIDALLYKLRLSSDDFVTKLTRNPDGSLRKENNSMLSSVLRQHHICASGLGIVGVFAPSESSLENDNKFQQEQSDRIFVRKTSSSKDGTTTQSFPWFQTTTHGTLSSVKNGAQLPAITQSAQIVFYNDALSHCYHNVMTSQWLPSFSCIPGSSQSKPASSHEPRGHASSWLVRIHNAPQLYPELLKHGTSSRASGIPVSTLLVNSEKSQSSVTEKLQGDSLEEKMQAPVHWRDFIFEWSLVFRIIVRLREDTTTWPFWALLSSKRVEAPFLLKDEKIQQDVAHTGATLHAIWNILLGLLVSFSVWMVFDPIWLQHAIHWQFYWCKGSLLVWLERNPIGIKVNSDLAHALTSVLTRFLDSMEGVWEKTLEVLLSPIVDTTNSLRHIMWTILAFLPTAVGGIEGWLACCHDLWLLATCHLQVMAELLGALFRMECHVLVATGRLFRGQKRNVLRNHRTDSMEYDSTQLLVGSIVFAVALFLFTTVLVYHVALLSLNWLVVHFMSTLLVSAFGRSRVELPPLMGALYFHTFERMQWFARDIYLDHEEELRIYDETSSATTTLDVTHLCSTQCGMAQLLRGQ